LSHLDGQEKTRTELILEREQAIATITRLEQALRARKFDPRDPEKHDEYKDIIASLRKNREYLMSLQQYAHNLPKSDRLKRITESNHQMIAKIEDTLALTEVRFWHQQTDWRPTMRDYRIATPKPTINAEAAALANKFNTSAKKMEAQKKSLWGRFKSLFS
jgi:hypothetical protein